MCKPNEAMFGFHIYTSVYCRYRGRTAKEVLILAPTRGSIMTPIRWGLHPLQPGAMRGDGTTGLKSKSLLSIIK